MAGTSVMFVIPLTKAPKAFMGAPEANKACNDEKHACLETLNKSEDNENNGRYR